jgi:hypothetical protein
MSFNLELDENKDIKLTSGKNLSLIYSPQNVAQQIEVRLRTFKGEWFLNQNLGIPFFTQILTKTRDKNRADTIFQNEVLKLSEVIKIDQFESNIDRRTREYTITNLSVKVESGETVAVGGI